MEEIPETAEEAVVEEQGIEEAFEIEEEAPVVAPGIVTEPARERIGEPSVRVAAAVPETGMPSKEEILGQFGRVIDQRVAALLSEIEIREILLSSLKPFLKDSVEKVLWEVVPELAEKTMKEILKSSVASLSTEVEKVIWETVPDLANTMIAKEIEKIKSEF